MRYLLVGLLLMIAGCQTIDKTKAPDVRVIDTVCTWARPLTISPDDTDETKRQILEYDLALKRICPELF